MHVPIHHNKKINAEAASLKQLYGVSVQEISSIEHLPGLLQFSIKNNEASVKLVSPNREQYLDYLNIVEYALAKYPPALTSKHLEKIYIGGGLRKNGGVIAGLYDKKNIYLFYNHPDGDNSAIFLEQSIHHEFSSILFEAYDFPAFDWLKLNPPDFNYIINPVKINEYMNSIKSYHASESQLKQGLVSSYGMANAENDINSYVELVFTQPEKMKLYVGKYPVIAKKYRMVKDFYLTISPDFSSTFGKID